MIIIDTGDDGILVNTNFEKITVKGEEAVRFCAGGYEAIMIPQVGANVISLKDTQRGLEFLRTPDDMQFFKEKPQVFGIPLLFHPNRIEDGTFEADGRIYNYPINEPDKNNHIHGFLHKHPFEVSRMESVMEDAVEIEAVAIIDKNTDFYKFYPHEFECRLLYKLSSQGLEQKLTFINKSDKAMPLGVGFHTAFRIPFSSGGTGEDYLMRVSVGDRWDLDERILPTGVRNELDENDLKFRNGGVPPINRIIDKALFSAEPIELHNAEFHGAIIEAPSDGVRLVYSVGNDYKHWMLWNMDGKSGFVCPEPQTWTVNAPNVDLSDEITGFKLLPPGEVWEKSSKIYVESL